jgi:protein-disulfide isomerase
MPRTMSSKSPKKKSNRQAQQDAAKRRNIIIASVVAVAVVAVAVVLIASGGGSDENNNASRGEGGQVSGQQEVKELFEGIPQSGGDLGKKDAPVTMLEFIDLQCPFCREFSLGPYPEIVNEYVRTGKVRIETRLLTFIGPDSEKAALAAAAAGEQDLQFNFQDLFFFNQGQENSGYVTDAFIDKLYKAAGVDIAKATKAREDGATREPIEQAQADAEEYGVVSTPSFVLGPTGGPYEKVELDIGDADQFRAALDALLEN